LNLYVSLVWKIPWKNYTCYYTTGWVEPQGRSASYNQGLEKSYDIIIPNTGKVFKYPNFEFLKTLFFRASQMNAYSLKFIYFLFKYKKCLIWALFVHCLCSMHTIAR
jgi:hypothetical protein